MTIIIKGDLFLRYDNRLENRPSTPKNERRFMMLFYCGIDLHAKDSLLMPEPNLQTNTIHGVCLGAGAQSNLYTVKISIQNIHPLNCALFKLVRSEI